jgi:hypothetical protein
LAREHTSTAIDTLVHIMSDKRASAAARVSAACAVLDRAYGKPTQHFENIEKPVREMSDAELMARIVELQERDDDEREDAAVA